MEKNEVVTLVCEGLGTQGEGIAHAGETTVFVPRFLPGERASVRILKTSGKLAYGRTEEIITPAEERVRPRCPVFGRCGGCQLQHMRYRAQLKFKTELVRDTLRKIGGVFAEVSPCERSEKDFAYRNKLQLPIGRVNGENAVGFYAERSHRIVRTSECPIHPAWAEKVIAALNTFMEKCGLDGYDEQTREGQLRHLVVRELKNKFIVTLVVCVKEIKGIDYFLYLLDGIFPEYSFYLNFNDGDTNVVLGETFSLLKGKGKYECVEAGISYETGANTFVQVNENVRGKLYERAVSLVGEWETVVDCYSGGGLLTALFAKKCGRAYGIEVVPEAHACAEALKERNGLANMTDLCGKVEEELPVLLGEVHADAVVLDPPRAGVERKVLRAIAERGVKKVIYISCNPATLARDLGILTGSLAETEKGELVKSENSPAYRISLVQPFDMFPQTKWVETLVCLERV